MYLNWQVKYMSFQISKINTKMAVKNKFMYGNQWLAKITVSYVYLCICKSHIRQ